MTFHYIPARDLPDDTDARQERDNEREHKRAARNPDDYGNLGHYLKPVKQDGEVSHG